MENPRNSSSNREEKSEKFETNFVNSHISKYLAGVLLAGGSLGLYYYLHRDDRRVYALEKGRTGVRKDGLRSYTTEEIGKHDNAKDGIWVYYKDGVYDITKFVSKHPGGSGKIMMAAGGSIEPFWVIFANHNVPEIHRLLESMRIGNVDMSDDDRSKAGEVYDPYGNEPRRHKALKVQGLKPFCAEPPAPMLVESFLTPL